MAQRTTLTERQIDVLRWIGDGCPDVVPPEEALSRRITAGALRNRGLATTSGRGPTWSAVITDTGGEYLARVDGPNPPVPREPNRPGTRALIDEIGASGGMLRVAVRRWNSPPGTPDYERRVANAERRGVVPTGKRLVVSRSGDELLIELRDVPEGTPTTARPVPVRERIGRYHPTVKEFRGIDDTHRISRAQFSRASRILQALVEEAGRRGYSVGVSRRSGEQCRRAVDSTDHGGDLVVTIDDVAVTLHLREEGVSRPVRPARPTWYGSVYLPERRSFDHEQGATGKLRLSVVSPYTRSNRQASWGDGRRQVLEDLLPAVLMEAETRAAEGRERIESERLEVERRRWRWEEAMELARVRHLEHHRAEILAEEVNRWKRAMSIRTYCDALAASQPTNAATAEWVSWAQDYANRIDPTLTARELPPPPTKASPSELTPFLDGRSPFGP